MNHTIVAFDAVERTVTLQYDEDTLHAGFVIGGQLPEVARLRERADRAEAELAEARKELDTADRILRDFVNHCVNGDFYREPVAAARKLLGDTVTKEGVYIPGRPQARAALAGKEQKP